MWKIEKIRKVAVISFICSGILAGIYEKVTALPEYEGKGQGLLSEIFVKVSMEGEIIKNIIVTSHGDTPQIAKKAIDELIPEIITKQSLEVDNIAGATYTSQGIKEAVRMAVKKSN